MSQKSQERGPVLASLEAHLNEHHINKYVFNKESKEPDWYTWKKNFINKDAEPLAIVRPQNAEDVAAIISYCVAEGLDFHVRVGGHELFGRSTIQDSLMIDLRDINCLKVSEDRTTAMIGGGILFEKLAEELHREKLFTPLGVVGTVGYVGWASHGGYGPFSPKYGLGVDQLVGAKVVNGEGQIVVADDRMLQGIRGACGNFGIIVEVTVKVYPLPTVKAGQIVFDSSNLEKNFRSAMTNYQRLLESKTPPNNLYIQPTILNFPGLGPTLFVDFVWAGDETVETEQWRSDIAGLSPTLSADIKDSAPLSIIKTMTPMIASSVFGVPQTVSLRRLTSEAIDVMTKHIAHLPNDPCVGFVLHSLRGKSCEPPFPETVWNQREPHIMVEFLGFASTADGMTATQTWSENFRNDLVKTDAVLEATYVSLTPPKFLDLDKIYGEKYKLLKELKREYDPKRVFKYAIPPL